MSKENSAFLSLRHLVIAAFCWVALGSGQAFAGEAPKAAAQEHPLVVFTCSHGSIKSLMAAMRFNKIATEQGIPVRAISRAANEDTVDATVPDPVAYAMAEEGYYVDEVAPKVLTKEEVTKALRVVHISLEDRANDPDAKATLGLPVERWDGIPSGLRDYPTTRKMIDERVDALVAEFAANQTSTASK